MTSTTSLDKEQLYVTYYPKVLQYARSHMSSPHEAEDLAQNVFLKVYAKLDSFDGEKSSLSTWIFNITRNSVIDHYRASSSRKHEELTEMIPDGSTGLAENLIMEEEQNQLAGALEQLSSMERDLIILRYYKNYTLVQISKMMRLSYEQTKRLHAKALKKMMMFMQDDGEGASAAPRRGEEPRGRRQEEQEESNVISFSLFSRRRP